MDKKERVLDYLFRAKKELEDSGIKEEQHALGYINEAIKWMHTTDSYEDITCKSNLRVKYLDKNDIEEVLKVKQLKGDDINLNFQILLDDSEDFYEINYDLDTKILNIELLKENEEGSYDTYTLFSYGVIKNKTEFKKLLNQLGIYGNTNNNQAFY